ncbi:plasmid pRiA4b ORF-3 family protein [Natronosporangium hydrolyticum]|uniref:Plasmid pRiA4b ORF-3 family protein n=1 Tax=Natronosporangium hydrolyticum TaxID=2811111 RepID=A0A895YQS1_9ACTN|nr:plasmid pRiA4b ORF-3 family protein [Natronosporangium hydrolyticum]QSB16470.1 plasmid pRiA4b ORF-3 family protein [Natronosporangium hydrolyticum]
MPRQIYDLRITLTEVTPTVWRRVLLPGAFTLDRVHRVVQLAMGWRDAHLHSFDIDGKQYGPGELIDDLDMWDEIELRLDQLVGKGDGFTYTYDYGDWWEHDLVVEDVFGAEPDQRYPLCVEGARACPIEDVGGPEGYRDYLEAMADPAHPEHDRLLNWYGPGHDPEHFDPGPVTTLLRRLV